MTSSSLFYLQNLVTGIPPLETSLNECLQKWSPETPPATIAFAHIGTAIGDSLALLSPDVRRRVFAAIENGMLSSDTDLETAMATGLIEALVASSDKHPGLWADLQRSLGSASMKHAEAWRTFRT
jgi:hypothetical protein